LNNKRAIYDDPGYTLDYKIPASDLAVLRELVTEQFLSNIASIDEELVAKFEKAGIDRYHDLSSLIEHEKAWPKLRRCLPQSSCERIKKLSFWKTIERDFAPFKLGPVVYEKEIDYGRDEMYWRIVRPDQKDDVGTLHADRWFHESMGIRKRVFPANGNALKLWLAIYVEKGLSGLAFVENSHKQQWDYKSVEIENTSKPRLGVDEDKIATNLLPTASGDIIIFNEDIVHIGAINKSNSTRISLEVTLIREHC
jgi:hypothetical protein